GVGDGLILSKSLIPHENVRNINLTLQTIDDLYIYIYITRWTGTQCRKDDYSFTPANNTQQIAFFLKSCHHVLNQLNFTLLEPRIGIVVDNIKCILGCMPNLIKLTLSIRDTPDVIFSNGPMFESILNEYVPHVRQFDYTMTHRILDSTSIQDFIRWPMDNSKYRFKILSTSFSRSL
ncbi:unnamed protein product, partial [Rotaria magnacalcarata]